MAETIISPGVFTRENDLSFLPQGVGAIGAAFIGPTQKGPAFVPTLIRNGFNEFIRKFGDQHPETYIPFAVKEYLRNAGVVTVVRVLAGGGYSFDGSTKSIAYVVEQTNNKIISTFIPSKQAVAGADVEPATLNLSGSTLVESTAGSAGAMQYGDVGVLTFEGFGITQKSISCSFDPTNGSYISKTVGIDANNNKSGANAWAAGKPAFAHINFEDVGASAVTEVRLFTSSQAQYFESTTTENYWHAYTPMITTGFLDLAKTTVDLFKFHTMADGDNTNTDYKVSITNLRELSNIDGEEQYSTFTVQIRKFSDTDANPSILEEFTKCNLNPNSPNFISRRIGDRYQQYSTDFGKVVTKGDYPNISEFIRVEVASGVNEGSFSAKYEPRGFRAVYDTIAPVSDGSTTYYMKNAEFATQQLIGTNYNTKGYLGWDFGKMDNRNWNKSVPGSAVNGASPWTNLGGVFNVDNYSMHPSASATYTGALSASVSLTGDAGPRAVDLKFSVPFQGGLDGIHPSKIKWSGANLTTTNAFGFDLSTTSAAGYKGYKKALDIMSNQDEYDINMLALPGVIKQLHASVTDAATVMAEDRGDAFYVMDLAIEESTVNNATAQADGLDSNYAAVYYPWVKVLDTSRNKPVFVPPSVIVPAAIAASDRIGAEWFAPAGLNRGVLGTVLEAKNRLNQAERDSLYENRVNPIATFPATGVCIWGQKTLQVRPTALDRINVRRLLITLKKFIASSSKYLVFEQNTIQTRNRFLNIVNPYLESVQQRQGLYAFRVVMDETNNTPTEIDRNKLVGGIYLQPTKTAEFIVLDFNILPTGATFPA
jgi:hypothetical protein